MKYSDLTVIIALDSTEWNFVACTKGYWGVTADPDTVKRAVQQHYFSDRYFSRELQEKSGVRIWGGEAGIVKSKDLKSSVVVLPSSLESWPSLGLSVQLVSSVLSVPREMPP
ncbi:hypothetical protein PV326_002472 [Microctonus aethiopoides]|nr:hypothetical protein PV326_002472 [Microctonus aethiopoides]